MSSFVDVIYEICSVSVWPGSPHDRSPSFGNVCPDRAGCVEFVWGVKVRREVRNGTEESHGRQMSSGVHIAITFQLL